MVLLKDTLNLPKTSFAMRGNLVQKEPDMLEAWHQQNLYQQLRRRRKGQKKFLLHWGPPYANGHLHAGHALNAILKDIIVRMKSMLGYDAPLVPGWDCHGLPIEWKVEEQVLKEKIAKKSMDVADFRARCRAFAEEWVAVQKTEFARLGLMADLEAPYLTMDRKSEALIAEALLNHFERGYLKRGERPIMWSVVEQTALAEAEVEYYDKESPSIHVGFPITHSHNADLDGALAVIWTTTPWTLVANRAVAFAAEEDYVLLEVTAIAEDAGVAPRQRLLMAAARQEAVMNALGITQGQVVVREQGRTLLGGGRCQHPLAGHGYDFDVPLLPGDHVTTESGTGLVHTAPAHGPDDFSLGKTFGLEVFDAVDNAGVFHAHVPTFAGVHIFKSEAPVLAALKAEGHLLASARIRHSYPHSWRSKKPLIFRTTPQWFISLTHEGLRERALNEIAATTWYPAQGQNRIRAMIADRPDWCISRQRSWGVPIPLVIHKRTRAPLEDTGMNDKIRALFRAHGTDVWFRLDLKDILPPECDPADYTKVTDILDVWFESGATQNFVLEERADLGRPADLYLEGSDQHRGWFQSSLLIGTALHQQAPFRAVLTHGFILDDHGYKLSKSKGNALSPSAIAGEFGIEILRLWVASLDYGDDVRLGKGVLKAQQDIYRRYRNTLRYLLGALHDQAAPRTELRESGARDDSLGSLKGLPYLERWVLARLYGLSERFKEATEAYSFPEFYRELHHFCTADLSSFYFDIRKDALYCDATSASPRRATLGVMSIVLEYLLHFLAPVLPCTAEEAWHLRYPHRDSLHLSEIPDADASWHDPEILVQVAQARHERLKVTTKLEVLRREGTMGSNLDAQVALKVPEDSAFRSLRLTAEEIADLLIVSEVTLGTCQASALSVEVAVSPHDKCERCWKKRSDVRKRATSEYLLCDRCDAVYAGFC